MKTILIKTPEDVDKLYQIFKKKMLKSFRDGDDPIKAAEQRTKWLIKKAGLSKLAASQYLIEFARVLLIDPSIDPDEWRDESKD